MVVEVTCASRVERRREYHVRLGFVPVGCGRPHATYLSPASGQQPRTRYCEGLAGCGRLLGRIGRKMAKGNQPAVKAMGRRAVPEAVVDAVGCAVKAALVGAASAALVGAAVILRVS